MTLHDMQKKLINDFYEVTLERLSMTTEAAQKSEILRDAIVTLDVTAHNYKD